MGIAKQQADIGVVSHVRVSLLMGWLPTGDLLLELWLDLKIADRLVYGYCLAFSGTVFCTVLIVLKGGQSLHMCLLCLQ